MDKEQLTKEIEELASHLEDSTGPLHRAWIKLRRAAALVRASSKKTEVPALHPPEPDK